MDAKIGTLFGFLILVLVATALAPTLFSNSNLSGVAGVPSWVVTLVPIIVGIFVVMLIYKSVK